MKKYYLLGLLCLLCLGLEKTTAQERGRQMQNPEEIVDNKMDSYSEELQLDDLQTALLRTHLIESFKIRRELMRNPEISREEKKARIKEINETNSEKMAEFLSEEQIARLRELMKKERSKRNPQRRGRWQ